MATMAETVAATAATAAVVTAVAVVAVASAVAAVATMAAASASAVMTAPTSAVVAAADADADAAVQWQGQMVADTTTGVKYNLNFLGNTRLCFSKTRWACLLDIGEKLYQGLTYKKAFSVISNKRNT